MPKSTEPQPVEPQDERLPFINCHTHTFTGDHVPPYVGKKLLPIGLGYIFTIPLIVDFFRWWFLGKQSKWKYKKPYKTLIKTRFKIRLFLQKIPFIVFPLVVILTIDTLYILFYRYSRQSYGTDDWFNHISSFKQTLQNCYLLPSENYPLVRATIVFILFVASKSGRNFVLFIAKSLFKFLKVLPGPQTKAYLNRYLSIGRFAFYENQSDIFERLKQQYPDKAKFVVLPMDMDYMEAGKPRKDYLSQLEEVIQLKEKNPENCLPFVFAEPRRIKDSPEYASKIRALITDQGFKGIKTYPALGYYPFDENLLELMLWACENEIPVLNHCIKGTIFFRGNKKPEWNAHEVFIQSTGEKLKTEPLALYDLKNSDFANQFTHPLNYVCLLKEPYLRKLLIKYNNQKLFDLFGYTTELLPLKKNLNDLKICFGHFGGEDQWIKYLESDRYQSNNIFAASLDTGIDFKEKSMENLWKYTSWFSIIYSLMLQHPNVYADISYILSDDRIFPLLKSLLQNNSLISDRILYGSDFYVVRSQKSDKQIWTDTFSNLSADEIELLTRTNPAKFLCNKIHQ